MPVGERFFADLAAEDSTFAGLYIEQGSLVVLTNASARVAPIRDLIGRHRDSMRETGRPDGDPLPVEVRVVEHSFLALHEWRRRALPQVLSISDFVSLDLDEYGNRLTIGLETGSGETDVRRVLASNGVPEDAVRIKVSGRPSLDTHTTLDDPHPFLQGGFQIRLYSNPGAQLVGACTSGFNAMIGPTPVFITNSHCSASPYATDGTVAYQPFPFLPLLGTEWLDPGPNCPGTCRVSDAAAFLHFSTNFDLGRIARTEFRVSGAGGQHGSLIIDDANPYFTIAGEYVFPVWGSIVNAMGQDSGWTFGVVGATCEYVDFEPGFWQQHAVFCATQATYSAEAGDSGAPIFGWSGANDIYLAGIHIGGDGPEWFSPLGAIEYDLGNLTVVAPPPPPSTPQIAYCSIGIEEGSIWINFETGAFTESVLIMRRVNFGPQVAHEAMDTSPGTSGYSSYPYYASYGTNVEFTVRPFSGDDQTGTEGTSCVRSGGIE